MRSTYATISSCLLLALSLSLFNSAKTHNLNMPPKKRALAEADANVQPKQKRQSTGGKHSDTEKDKNDASKRDISPETEVSKTVSRPIDISVADLSRMTISQSSHHTHTCAFRDHTMLDSQSTSTRTMSTPLRSPRMEARCSNCLQPTIPPGNTR